MVWGQKQGVADWVTRLQKNDATLTSLTILRFRQFGHEEVVQLCAGLEHNTTLTELYSSGHKMEPRSVEVFAGMLANNRTLKHICIGDATFGDEGMAALAKGLPACQSLQRLDLENKGIGVAGMAHLAAAVSDSRSLELLSLARNGVQNEGVAALCVHGFGTLKELDLSDCSVGSEGCSHLSTALNGNSTLERLRMDGNLLACPDPAPVAQLITSTATTLRELYLRGTAIGDAGLTGASECAPTGATLELLDLSSCGIGPAGGSALAGLSAKLTKLKHLILRDNELGNSGVCALSAALCSKDHCLEELDIGNNQVDGGVLAPLAKVRVEKLGLFANKLGDSGALELAAAALQGGFVAVEELDLSGCGLSLEGMNAVVAMVRDGAMPHLKVLLLGANPAVQEDGWEPAVQEMREARPALDVAWRTNDPGDKPSAPVG